jgi:signal transduction histidine kinase
VAKLTSIMNGKIELESEAGKGCIFTVVLPLKEIPT